jgi:tight adherence protein C
VIVFLLLGLLFIAVAVGALMLTLVGGRRLRTEERLATINRYGFEATSAPVQSALPAEPVENPLVQVMTRIGDFVSARIGTVGEEDMRHELMAAGMYTTSPRTILGYRIIAPIILPILAYVVFGAGSTLDIAIIVLMIPIGWSLPLVIVQRKARFRLDEIDRKLPDLIDLLCVMVEAGLGFGGALRLAADEMQGPLTDELRLTLQEQTMGLSVGEAMSHMSDRCDTPAMKAFVRAMTQGERMGISTGQIMRNLSHEMRARRRSQAEERAQKAPIKMLFPLVFLIFPSIFIILVTPAAIQLVKSLKF